MEAEFLETSLCLGTEPTLSSLRETKLSAAKMSLHPRGHPVLGHILVDFLGGHACAQQIATFSKVALHLKLEGALKSGKENF